MRAGKIGRTVGRAIIVGLLTAGAWWAATAAAHADFDWQFSPADGPAGKSGGTSVTVESGK